MVSSITAMTPPVCPARANHDIGPAAELGPVTRADEKGHGSSSNSLREGRSSQDRGGGNPAFTSFDQTVIHYEQVGSGEPVLLLHSFPFDSGIWASAGVADAITAPGCSVMAADRRGCGRSARPHDPSAYGGNACARDVTSLIDHLRFDRVDLAGYSIGP